MIFLLNGMKHLTFEKENVNFKLKLTFPLKKKQLETDNNEYRYMQNSFIARNY